MLKGSGDEAVQDGDEALNGNGKALNDNGKALKCVGEVLKNTLFSKKYLINLIAINMTFNHQIVIQEMQVKNLIKYMDYTFFYFYLCKMFL